MAKRLRIPSGSFSGPVGFRKTEVVSNSFSSPQSSPSLPKPIPKLLTSAEMSTRREGAFVTTVIKNIFPGIGANLECYTIFMTGEEESIYSQEVTELEIAHEDSNPTMDEVQLSLNALLGESGLTTIRVIGEVRSQQLNILLDTGSTLSFLQEDTARKLGCTIQEDRPLLVRVVNGQKLISTTRAADFK